LRVVAVVDEAVGVAEISKVPVRSLAAVGRFVRGVLTENAQKAPARSRSLHRIFRALHTARAE
jgi:hypothetical protein